MRAFYLTKDLMFSSRVAGAAQVVNASLQTVMSIPALSAACEAAGGCDFLLVDLTMSEVTDAFFTEVISRYPACRIVAYGPHVHAERLQSALAAGCTEVLTRGQFNQDMHWVLRQYLCG